MRTSIELRWYLQEGLRELMPIFPIYAVMMEDFDQTPVAISWLLIIWSLAAFIFEVPAGAISDRLSRRSVLLWSRVLQALAFAIWWFEPSFLGFALGFVIWGLAGSLWSGTADAWLYEALHQEKRELQFERIYGRGSALSQLSIAIAMLLGGFLATIGYGIAIAVSALLSLSVGIFVTLTFGNPPRALKHEGDRADQDRPLRAAIQDFRKSSLIRHAALSIALGLAFYGCFEEYVGLLFSAEGLSLGTVGLAYGACYLARAIAQALADRIPTKWTPLVLLTFSGIPLGLSTLSANSWWLLLGCMVYFAANGIAHVRIIAAIQEETSGSARATVMSLARLGILATGPLIYIVSGSLVEISGWIAAAWVAAIGTTLISAVLLILHPKRAQVRETLSG